MSIHLRQICLVADELAPAVEQLSAALSIQPCHIDPQVAEFGLENTLLPVASNFIEVVAPIQADTAAGRFLQRRDGAGGYMVICQVPQQHQQTQCRERARACGVRVAWEMQRDGWRLMQLHPRDMGAAFLEVDWHREADVTGFWGPAGGDSWRDKQNTDVVSAMVGAEIQADDPAAMAAHWAEVIGVDVLSGASGPCVPLANALLRFVPLADGRGAGLGGVDLQVADRPRLLRQARAAGCAVHDDHVMICGTRFYFHQFEPKEIPNA